MIVIPFAIGTSGVPKCFFLSLVDDFCFFCALSKTYFFLCPEEHVAKGGFTDRSRSKEANLQFILFFINNRGKIGLFYQFNKSLFKLPLLLNKLLFRSTTFLDLGSSILHHLLKQSIWNATYSSQEYPNYNHR